MGSKKKCERRRHDHCDERRKEERIRSIQNHGDNCQCGCVQEGKTLTALGRKHRVGVSGGFWANATACCRRFMERHDPGKVIPRSGSCHQSACRCSPRARHSSRNAKGSRSHTSAQHRSKSKSHDRCGPDALCSQTCTGDRPRSCKERKHNSKNIDCFFKELARKVKTLNPCIQDDIKQKFALAVDSAEHQARCARKDDTDCGKKKKKRCKSKKCKSICGCKRRVNGWFSNNKRQQRDCCYRRYPPPSYNKFWGRKKRRIPRSRSCSSSSDRQRKICKSELRVVQCRERKSPVICDDTCSHRRRRQDICERRKKPCRSCRNCCRRSCCNRSCCRRKSSERKKCKSESRVSQCRERERPSPCCDDGCQRCKKREPCEKREIKCCKKSRKPRSRERHLRKCKSECRAPRKRKSCPSSDSDDCTYPTKQLICKCRHSDGKKRKKSRSSSRSSCCEYNDASKKRSVCFSK